MIFVILRIGKEIRFLLSKKGQGIKTIVLIMSYNLIKASF